MLIRPAYLCSALFLTSTTAHAFPVFLKASEMAFLQGYSRDRIVAFAQSPNKQWSRIALQVDEVENDTFLVIRNPKVKMKLRDEVAHPGDRDPFRGLIKKFHRVVLEDSEFGSCIGECEVEARKSLSDLCEIANGPDQLLTRIDLKLTGKTAFVGTCKAPIPEAKQMEASFNVEKRTYETTKYQAGLSEKSPFLLNHLSLGKNRVAIFGESQLVARLKPKYSLGFAVNIKDKDLAAWPTSVVTGSVGMTLELAKTDRVMGFGAAKQVCCDMTFYKDSFYFPILIEAPSTLGALRNGSGVYLGFQYKAVDGKTEPILGPNDGPPVLVFAAPEGGYVGISFRFDPSVHFKMKILKGEKELKNNYLQGFNSGIFLDLEGAKGEQRLEAWIVVGESEAQVREYAAHGAKFAWKTL